MARQPRYFETDDPPLYLKHIDDRSGVLVSTVLLPIDHSDMGGNYETCIFNGAMSSEVVERYYTIEQAKIGHAKWVVRVAQYGYDAVKMEWP